jgi:murein endopeptidase
MRALVVGIALLALTTTAVEARPRPKPSRLTAEAHAKRAKAKRLAVARKELKRTLRQPIRGQSVGVPWAGVLRDPTRLPEGDGYHIRRPWRAFGTRTTVRFVERVLTEVIAEHSPVHVIAIGDLSAEPGGWITEHSSHQSGRDIDIGLVFLAKPDSYPARFIDATADTLDRAATFALVERFAATAQWPGGVQAIFLDYDVQGLLYEWALANGRDADELAQLFQYPHGRGRGIGLVRHEPKHADHLHVRFRCPPGDTGCR